MAHSQNWFGLLPPDIATIPLVRKSSRPLPSPFCFRERSGCKNSGADKDGFRHAVAVGCMIWVYYLPVLIYSVVCSSRSKNVLTEDKLLLAAAIICAASYLLDQSGTNRVRINPFTADPVKAVYFAIYWSNLHF